MNQQLNQITQTMMSMMVMSMGMGMVKPVMLQESESPGVAKQGRRIKEIIGGSEHYEKLAVTASDDELCMKCGYHKGALCKYREVKTGMISTFCRLE